MENSKINQIIDLRQSPQWGEYLKYLGWQKHSLGDCKNIYSRQAGPLTIAKMQRPANLTTDNLKNIDDLAIDNKFAFVKLEPSLEQGVDELTRAHCKISQSPLCPPSTIFIDLQHDVETLHSDLSRSAKYSINRAKREEGHVDFYSNPSIDLLSQVYPALKDTAIKQKFFVPSFDDLKTKINLWGSECHFAVVKNSDGVIQGAKMFLGFNGNVWFMHGGTSEEGRKTKFGYLLLWESILYLKSCGYKFLDLEGRDDKRFPSFTKTWGGFSHFKERFGGIEAAFPYPQIKYYSLVLKFLSRLYNSAIPL
ncbi:hypothetical protein COT50_00730 [candidate division WWE3 bacterium CG08_land_8_20_14_0_20_41_10]|uniref:BioF2-like acetyltransferase domain-containing protein n=1 Tax=candidate division WWE3 bacterium CG08_land_8_20_14_0_20_41_10 TaxID=1975085 RepID=A0A2H0XCL3_UNCKA|nr:MAG: hypothetical protein COT50_00730 [candidate division WWE3 bacterium CG08_land_8_20_14_0_20_41_10]